MKLIKLTPQKNTAQAMVEFAIALPILLLLLYGLLEAGRLLFVYSSTVTASRQAARYGATSGTGTGGIAHRYWDCAGIRAAAQKVDYLNAFDNDDIHIYHDTGPGSTPTLYCTSSSDSTYIPATNNADRLIVRITGDFNPIVQLIPFAARTVANGNPIETTSARTILVSITIDPPATGAETTSLTLNLNPHRNPSTGPHSDVGELVVATATVTNTTGSTVPTGTVDFIVRDSLGTEVARCDNVTLDSSGIAACNITFNNEGTFNVHAEYTPNNTSLFTPSSDDEQQIVGKASTTTTIVSDNPDSSRPGQAVIIQVQVTGAFGSMPTGTVAVTTTAGGCTINLVAGVGSCSVTYNTEGTTNISAAYGGDARHLSSSDSTESHTVSSIPPTAIPPTAIPPTVPPTTGPTALPTPVSNCNSIRDTIHGTNNPIKFATNTMYLDIPNTNVYPVTLNNIYVVWNYNTGHVGSDTNLRLMNVTLGSTTIWSSSTGVHQPNYTISSFSNPAVIPAGGTTKLTFTFDQNYNRKLGEQIQIQFLTPGCESYPVLVPVGSSTPVAPTLVPGTCGPVSASISAPFTRDGVGTFCWQATNLGSYINSWNLQNLTINGVNFTNQYIPSVTYPAKINGYWYVTYTSNVDWGHFEVR